MTENKKGKKRVALTKETLSQLKHHKKRTGVGPQELLKVDKSSIPENLSSAHIKHWLDRKIKTAPITHLEYVLKTWSNLPDYTDVFTVLNKGKREGLHNVLKETGMSPRRLFSNRDDIPKGFSWQNIYEYFRPKRKTIKSEYYNYIIQVCEEHKNQGYTEITQELRDKIIKEAERTGVKINKIEYMARIHGMQPVRSNVIQTWINGAVKKADKQAIVQVFELFKILPDKGS